MESLDVPRRWWSSTRVTYTVTMLLWMLYWLDWLISRGQKARIYTDLSSIFSAIFVSISISVCSFVCTDMSRSVLIRAALLRHIFIHKLHIKRTWAVRLTMQVHMQQTSDSEWRVTEEWRSIKAFSHDSLYINRVFLLPSFPSLYHRINTHGFPLSTIATVGMITWFEWRAMTRTTFPRIRSSGIPRSDSRISHLPW